MEGAPVDQDRRFAEWYVWAKREISTDNRVCLGAAQAGIEAMESGADEQSARTAARRSTAAGLGQTLLASIPARRKAYAEWYDWARREVGGDRERLHRAADEAMQRLDAGGDAVQAADAARVALGASPTPMAVGVLPASEPHAAAPMMEAAHPPSAPPPPYAAVPPPPFGPYPVPAAMPVPAAAPSHAYAGFLRRLAAYLIDAVLLAVGLGVLTYVLGFIALIGLISSGQDPNDIGINLLVDFALLVLDVVLAWLYFAGLEASAWQGTIGKRVLRLVVTDVYGRRIGFGRATGRYFGKILSGLLLFAGYIVILFTRRRQGLHDMLAGTLVVRQEHLGLVATSGQAASAPVQPQGA